MTPRLASESNGDITRKKWRDLSPRVRRVLLVLGSLEGLLKFLALADLRRRPARDVNGSKRKWALAISFINSAGTVPVIYFLFGRRRS